METEFTKGKWTISKTKKGYYAKICSNSWSDLARVVIKIKGSNTEDVEGLSNAKLIAAAPELLIALSNLLDELEDQSLSSSTNLYIENAKKAIKKATE